MARSSIVVLTCLVSHIFMWFPLEVFDFHRLFEDEVTIRVQKKTLRTQDNFRSFCFINLSANRLFIPFLSNEQFFSGLRTHHQ